MINIKKLILLIPCTLLFAGCKVTYSFSGASISPEVKTVSIPRFPNNALLVAPILSSTLTEALQDRFSRQTRLTLVPEGGDLNFEGEITNYTSTRRKTTTRRSPPSPLTTAISCSRTPSLR